tara:strand:+ start:434 stop:649 length:216 start_codon:yes stop_codon:yes gene_type:complete
MIGLGASRRNLLLIPKLAQAILFCAVMACAPNIYSGATIEITPDHERQDLESKNINELIRALGFYPNKKPK